MHLIKSDMPLTIVDLPSGRFAVSGSTWIRVPGDMTLDQARLYWVEDTKYKDRIAERKADTKEWMCLASNGRDQYTISYVKSLNKWKCNCIGFKTHGTDCKHIKKIKAQENL